MTPYTPGPWRAWQERAPHGPWCVTLGKDGGELMIGFLADGTPDEANARLIAAAPDLLKTLQEIANSVDILLTSRALPQKMVAGLTAISEVATAAIAKATP